MKKFVLFLLTFGMCIPFLSQASTIKNEYNDEFHVINKDTLLRIDPNPQEGFNFPYYIFIPSNIGTGKKITLIVQPNNTGFPNDTLQIHEDDAKSVASKKFYVGNYVSRKLGIPLLVPVFPREESNWRIYTHALDRDAVIANGDIERLDLQLISMINDAKDKLKKYNIQLEIKVFLTGFSASGTFVNRFALIQPEIVKGYASGGINAILMLPCGVLEGRELNYPIGINDFTQLFGKNFNHDEFINIPQFLYMGENDDNDAVKYNDGYDDLDRLIIYDLLGKEMIPKRWESCQRIYNYYQVKATFKTYKEIGHKKNNDMKDDIVNFFSKLLDNK